MGTEMIDFSISWDAPIVPSEAIAGIPLGIPVSLFDLVLSRYLLKGSTSLYQFEGSPVLKLDRTLDLNGNGGYLFSVCNVDLTNWKEVSDSPHAFGINPSALIVSVESNFINVIRVFLFERFKNKVKPIHSYQGKLYNKIGLGTLEKTFCTSIIKINASSNSSQQRYRRYNLSVNNPQFFSGKTGVTKRSKHSKN